MRSSSPGSNAIVLQSTVEDTTAFTVTAVAEVVRPLSAHAATRGRDPGPVSAAPCTLDKGHMALRKAPKVQSRQTTVQPANGSSTERSEWMTFLACTLQKGSPSNCFETWPVRLFEVLAAPKCSLQSVRWTERRACVGAESFDDEIIVLLLSDQLRGTNEDRSAAGIKQALRWHTA